MTVSVTHLAAGEETVTFPMVTSSVSPSGDVLIYVNISGTGITIASISGCGLTWSQVTSIVTDWGGNNFREFLWKGIGTPSAGSITVTFTGGTPDAAAYIISNVTGHNTSGMIVQSSTATGTGTTAAASLGAFADAGNATFAVGAYASAGTNTITAGTGFTELVEYRRASFTIGIASEWRADNDTTPDQTVDISRSWAFTAVEIAAAGGGGGGGASIGWVRA